MAKLLDFEMINGWGDALLCEYARRVYRLCSYKIGAIHSFVQFSSSLKLEFELQFLKKLEREREIQELAIVMNLINTIVINLINSVIIDKGKRVWKLRSSRVFTCES